MCQQDHRVRKDKTNLDSPFAHFKDKNSWLNFKIWIPQVYQICFLDNPLADWDLATWTICVQGQFVVFLKKFCKVFFGKNKM